MGKDSKYGLISVTRHSPIPDDEPVFLIRGHDYAAPAAIHAYAEAAAKVGASPEFVAHAHAVADDVVQWQDEHADRCKIPD